MPKVVEKMPTVTKGGKPVKIAPLASPKPSGGNGDTKKPKPSKKQREVVVRKEREIVYPAYTVQYCCDGDVTQDIDGKTYSFKGVGPITCQQARDLLGWQTEAEYTAEVLENFPDTLPEDAVFSSFVIQDQEGNKVNCWNNVDNRPLRMNDCLKRAQDILNKQWRFNMETIIIGKTGKIISGQHRLIGLVLAGQMWDGEDDHWRKIWPEEPTIESLVAFGCDETEDVVRTIDNVVPRSGADIIYTDPVFAHLEPTERKLCSRMLDSASDMLWRRTGGFNSYSSQLTHPVKIEMIHNHPKLKDILLFMRKLAEDSILQMMSLRPGECATLAYLFAASLADGDKYRAKDPRSESVLTKSFNTDVPDWEEGSSSMLEMAQAFFSRISGKHPAFGALYDLACPREDDIDRPTGKVFSKSGNHAFRIATIIRAWQAFLANPTADLQKEDLQLHYKITPADYGEGNPVKTVELFEDPPIGGIDLGEPKKRKADVEVEDMEDPDAVMDEVEDTKEDARKQISQKHFQKVQEAKSKGAVAKSIPAKGAPAKGVLAKEAKSPLKGGTISTAIRMDDGDGEEEQPDAGNFFDAAWHKLTKGDEDKIYYSCRESFMAAVANAIAEGEEMPDADQFVMDEAPSHIRKPKKILRK